MNIGTTAIVVAVCLFVADALPATGAPPEETAVGAVVVNEFAAGMYVELRNDSQSAVDISGFTLWLCGSGAVATELRMSFGQTLSPGGFYLVASSSFTGAQADQTYWDVLPSGGATLLDPDYGWVDGVAVSGRSPCGEGAPAPACGHASTARAATDTDTGDNATDFACRARSPGASNL